MPGYPFVLVTTDLLQEGEDLHTFCSAIQHYGISWTASSMEQRIRRIDRGRSQSDRLLSSLDRDPEGDDLLQVYFPRTSGHGRNSASRTGARANERISEVDA